MTHRIIGFKPYIVLIILFSAWVCVGVPMDSNLPPVPTTVDSITPGELRMHLDFLASDELGGRYTLAPNFAISARYLASHLKAYGFRGAGANGDFLQFFDVVSSKPDTTKTLLSLTTKGQSSSYKYGDFFIFGASANADVQGQLVFVGYGISSASQKHDDYAGLNVKGKVVVVAPGTPQGIDTSKLGDSERGNGAARSHGAVAVLTIPQQQYAGFLRSQNFREHAGERESIRLAKEDERSLPAVVLGPDLADKILAPLGLDLKALYEADKLHQPIQPKPMDASAHIVLSIQGTKSVTQNVAGILDGADPQLKNEYVVFSAHYDHLKTGANGEIYHGADDDGSGTTAVLAIAHAMSMDRPKRSVLIMFHAGEELGLLGSQYNTDFSPVVPLDKMVVDLNIDMIGRSKPSGDKAREDAHLTDANTVYLVGSNRINQELHKISEDTNADYQKLNLDYYYNDPNNPEQIYFRSDHWNYAKHGIPIIFYFDGTHVDYHKPTDTVDKIDFTKLANITRLVFETGWRIANLDHRLSRAAE